jgi:hypothetical protein
MNAYDKLRPWTDIEACECESVTGLLLLDLLTDNPLHCAACRREVDPKRLALSTEETEEIARWFSAAKSLYWLWLDSGEYEAYAKARLLDPQGQINVRGRTIAARLSAKISTQLWFFHDTDDGVPTACPFCRQPLNKDVRWGTGQCVECCIRV